MAILLLVDDDPLQAFVRKSLLDKNFPDVRRVRNAAEALCLIEQPAFASELRLVIYDRKMPGMSGAEFVAELRTRMPSLPLLVLENALEKLTSDPASGICVAPESSTAEELLDLAVRLLSGRQITAA